ncbi:MAG: hypothetical protein HYU67_04500 [Flavobacteriia bacterium]|nr:hypothetical protein [Flavobacteriia bacterium]
METKKIQSPTKQLKDTFKSIRDPLIEDKKISIRKFSDFVMIEDPSYESLQGLERIRNTFYGRSADYRLTELLKRYLHEKAYI